MNVNDNKTRSLSRFVTAWVKHDIPWTTRNCSMLKSNLTTKIEIQQLLCKFLWEHQQWDREHNSGQASGGKYAGLCFPSTVAIYGNTERNFRFLRDAKALALPNTVHIYIHWDTMKLKRGWESRFPLFLPVKCFSPNCYRQLCCFFLVSNYLAHFKVTLNMQMKGYFSVF